MAEESPLLHWGWGVAGADYRNSTYSGTTHAGNGGSPQFQAVRLSTAEDQTILLCTSSTNSFLGILQNKPNDGDAADVGIFGVSKAVAGTTTVVAGIDLMPDSSGCLIPYSSAAGQRAVGMAITSASAVGEVFSMLIYGGHGGSVA